MNEPILIFETDPRMGTPRVHAVNGAAKSWSPRDLNLLEDQLRPRYNEIVRDGAGTIEFQGQTWHVQTQRGRCQPPTDPGIANGGSRPLPFARCAACSCLDTCASDRC